MIDNLFRNLSQAEVNKLLDWLNNTDLTNIRQDEELIRSGAAVFRFKEKELAEQMVSVCRFYHQIKKYRIKI